MKYLLDTHTYFWWRDDVGRLSAKVRGLLSDRKNELMLSVVTPWELSIKCKAGKLDCLAMLRNFEERERAAGFAIVRASATQAIRSGFLPLHHKDPLDRLLAAQALDLRIPLLSRDSVFDRYGVERVWD